MVLILANRTENAATCRSKVLSISSACVREEEDFACEAGP